MRKWVVVSLAVAGLGCVVIAEVAGPAVKRLFASSTGVGAKPEVGVGSARLHNGWAINPVGRQLEFPDMPTLTATTPDNRFLLVGSSGVQAHVLKCFSIGAGGELGAPTDSVPLGHTWRGLAVRAAQSGSEAEYEVFVSGASKGNVLRFLVSAEGKFKAQPPIALPTDKAKPFTGAISLTTDGNLVVIDENADKRAGKKDLLYVLNSATGEVIRTVPLTAEAGAMALSPDSKEAYVADYERAEVSTYDLAEGKLLRTTSVGKQPTALSVGQRGTLFCVNSGGDSVSVINRANGTVTETIATGLSAKAPLGSLPNAISVSKDETKLFVSNAGNNAVCVIERKIDAEGTISKVQGFIPTGWYPVSVRLSPDESALWLGVGKGFAPMANAKGTKMRKIDTPGIEPSEPSGPEVAKIKYDYIMSTLKGGLTTVSMPDAKTLRDYTDTVMKSSPYRESLLARAEGRPSNSVLPDSPLKASPIEHVVYIIKENRTYDQVFGDMPKGNGDPGLVMYGREISTNHHRLAEQFVLLDNTYCDGEVSQDGWEWSCAANDSDWDIKATTNSYSGKGNPPGGRETIRPSNDYLWEAADKKGLTYNTYGAKSWRGLFSPTWKGHMSEEWNQGRTDNVPDYLKADIFIRDLKRAEATGKWDNLTLMSLADDHTSGTRAGAATPAACVASNDIALGKVVEAITKSKFWAKTAIFVIEDDAQNGPDHVDSHRTVALVISPYTKRGTLDSTMYTSSSLLRSIELCLGIPPLSQYDAGAAPMFRCFTGKLDLRPYECVIPKVDLNGKNPAVSKNAKLSASLDFSDVDLADFRVLNRILWEDRKPGIPYPAPVSRFTR